MSVEEESCPVYDIDNKEEELMPVYDTDIEEVIEEEDGDEKEVVYDQYEEEIVSEDFGKGFGEEEDTSEDTELREHHTDDKDCDETHTRQILDHSVVELFHQDLHGQMLCLHEKVKERLRNSEDDVRKRIAPMVNKLGPRDAQMLVDKLNDRKKHVPNFSFEYKTVNDELSRMFWADGTMKCNYIAFDDVVSFDATYRTNRYRMIFVPFIGIDHNQKSVTFGAGLLSDETFHSYTWLLTACKQAHGKKPLMAVTDQDVALRNAIKFVFPKSRHRDRWIPSYFKDLPMCCLMKTTSRSESSNAFFWIHSHSSNMLVQFMLCFEAVMEKQRYTQCIVDNRTFESTPVMFTALPIERFACRVYSRSIFKEVQKEISKGLYYCSYISVNSEDGSKVCVIRQTNKRNETVLNVKVNKLKKNLDDELPLEPQKSNNEDIFQKLLGVTTPNEVVVKVSKGIRNKGCGTGGARFIRPGEKAKNKAKTKQQGRSCSICFETGHNMRTCKRNKSKGKEIVAEESEDEEQVDDNDTSDHATLDTE
nr:hypothetical protein [Tanacetum cinerariifolium]